MLKTYSYSYYNIRKLSACVEDQCKFLYSKQNHYNLHFIYIGPLSDKSLQERFVQDNRVCFPICEEHSLQRVPICLEGPGFGGMCAVSTWTFCVCTGVFPETYLEACQCDHDPNAADPNNLPACYKDPQLSKCEQR